MSLNYKAVGWNRQKKIYDRTLVLAIGLYLILFIVGTVLFRPGVTAEALIIRGFGTAALILLHVILSIGPLCRLNRKFLPLLYNRRHMGVTMFLLAFIHGGFSIIQFHALGDMNPFISVFLSNKDYTSLTQFPFQPLGFTALIIFFLMAATSHDFWLANLSAPVWKGLHMMVYVAYALVVMHVVLGVLQAETHPLLSGLLGVGLVWVLGLHLVAGWKGRDVDRQLKASSDDGFIKVCRVDDIPEKRGRIFCLSGERVAVFKYDGKVSAISNVCQHQNGPLGEGWIIDGFVTCPWHGFQYDPASGSSPPPFTEKIPTFAVKVEGEDVWVNSNPKPAGTFVEPAQIG